MNHSCIELTCHDVFSGHLPLHRLKVVQEGTETTTAFKHHRAKAPVVHSNSVWFILKQFWGLQSSSFNERHLTTLSIYSE